MSQYFPKPFGGYINAKVDLSNCETKLDLKIHLKIQYI